MSEIHTFVYVDCCYQNSMGLNGEIEIPSLNKTIQTWRRIKPHYRIEE